MVTPPKISYFQYRFTIKFIDQITLLVLYLLFIYNKLFFHIFQQWLRKNDCSRTLLVRVTFEELVQLRHCSIGPDFPYALFDYLTFKIFCLKTQFLGKMKYMPQARYKAGVPKDGRSQWNCLNNAK